MKKHRGDPVGKGAIFGRPIGEEAAELLKVAAELGGGRVVSRRKPAVSEAGGPTQASLGSPATNPDRDGASEWVRFELLPKRP